MKKTHLLAIFLIPLFYLGIGQASLKTIEEEEIPSRVFPLKGGEISIEGNLIRLTSNGKTLGVLSQLSRYGSFENIEILKMFMIKVSMTDDQIKAVIAEANLRPDDLPPSV